MSNSISAQCGHVKRRLRAGEPLKGKVLQFALSIIDQSSNPLEMGIAKKLNAGEPLGEYEYHVFVEVVLLHVRLGSSRRRPAMEGRA
jgi:hypothetical protein